MTYILLPQEILLTNDNSDILENINPNFNVMRMCYPLENQINFMGGLVVNQQIYGKNTNIKYFSVHGSNRFIALKLFFGEICYLLLNVYLNCDYRIIESLIGCKENFAEIEEKIADGEYDELYQGISTVIRMMGCSSKS